MDNVTTPITTMISEENETAAALSGNLKAMMMSGHIWASSCQASGQAIAASAQARMERNMATWKAMTQMRSPTESMAVGANFARTSVAIMLTETKQLADISMKLAEQIMAPMADRMTLATEKLTQVAR